MYDSKATSLFFYIYIQDIQNHLSCSIAITARILFTLLEDFGYLITSKPLQNDESNNQTGYHKPRVECRQKTS